MKQTLKYGKMAIMNSQVLTIVYILYLDKLSKLRILRMYELKRVHHTRQL